ncbi:MAG TPA: ATP-grasp domain-containing protein [Candidatus Acidoferrales bacterium]|nr:ATP-grasp domain-containing protein [Candidatus Acidoferrales bacterium]
MTRLRVLALAHKELVPPENVAGHDIASADWKTEFDVISALREMGHDTRVLGVADDLGVIRQATSEWKPHIVFNLLEVFHNVGVFDQNVVSYLELLRLPYTGCNPRGLMLARDKGLSKELLSYHRIPVPDFVAFPRGRKVKRPKGLAFPLIVKSLTQEASIGIAQASVVEDDQKLCDRVDFIHQSIGTDAIVESYIDGRELYVGVIGNQRLAVLPIWELLFTNLPEDARPIATERVKWSLKYQEKCGIVSGEAKDLSPETADQIRHICKRVYRVLQLSGYARIDLRMDAAGKIYVLEANPNPQLAKDEDFAESAKSVGVSYHKLLQRIINLGLSWRPERPG